MKDLIERLERATGADRELDCLIWAARSGYEPIWRDNDLLARNRKPPHDTCWLGSIDPGKTQRNFSETRGFNPPIPAYTGSLDAALTLVPPDHDWIVASVNGQVGGTPYASVGDEKMHFGETPVLSLCIAALRAREFAERDLTNMEAGE
jgi:hypothetical protein